MENTSANLQAATVPGAAPQPSAGGFKQRSAKDKAVIVGLSVLLVVLLCGVVWGVTTIVSTLQAEQNDAAEMAARPVPATPDELRAEQASQGEVASADASDSPADSGMAVSQSEDTPVSGTAATDTADAAQQQAVADGTDADAAQDGTQAADASATAAAETVVDPSTLVDNPIDFAELQKENADIYAWLYIPNTGINLPVLQNPFDDSFYLTHDPHRDEDVYGSVFSQMANKKDFSDPVTVLYGHDGEGQFKNLHYFEDEKFFEENDKIYVYTTGHILTYRVVAAYKYDNRHILNSFDFTKQDVLQGYFDSILNPDSLLLQVREGVTLDAASDKIIQLSTCMLDEFHGSSRFIVTGVLVDDQLTR